MRKQALLNWGTGTINSKGHLIYPSKGLFPDRLFLDTVPTETYKPKNLVENQILNTPITGSL